MVQGIRMSSYTAGPRRGGQSKGNGVGHSTHRAFGIQRAQSPTPCWPVRAFALACPSSANSSPRRAGWFRVDDSGPSLRGPLSSTRIRFNSHRFSLVGAAHRSGRWFGDFMHHQRLSPSLFFEAVLVFGFVAAPPDAQGFPAIVSLLILRGGFGFRFDSSPSVARGLPRDVPSFLSRRFWFSV
jgi:hypothetical protein